VIHHELFVHAFRRAPEQAAAADRFARAAARTRRRTGRWRRFVAWMPPPTSGGAAAPAVPYPVHDAG
jgi:hypothetical protein